MDPALVRLGSTSIRNLIPFDTSLVLQISARADGLTPEALSDAVGDIRDRSDADPVRAQT